MAITGNEWYVKFYRRIKWHIKEINKTFSGEPSYYSTKRLERFALMLNGLIIFDAYLYTHWASIEFNQALEAFVVNLGYAGFLMTKAQQEKKNSINNSGTNTNTGDTNETKSDNVG